MLRSLVGSEMCIRDRTKGSFTDFLTYSGTQSKRSFCLVCKEPHKLFKCSLFLKLSPKEKLVTVKTNRLWFNCLCDTHSVRDCPSRYRCFERKCGMKHHTTLHDALRKVFKSENKDESAGKPKDSQQKHTGYCSNRKRVYLKVVPVRITENRSKHSHCWTVEDLSLIHI